MNDGKTVQTLLDEGKSYALNMFQEEGTVEATAIVTTLRDHFLLIMEQADEETRRAFRESVDRVIREEKALGVCMVAEIWYDTVPPHVSKLPDAEKAASPVQREGILVCAEDSSGHSACVLSEIRRDGNQVEIGSWHKLGGMESQSIFTGFFRTKTAFLN